MADETGGSVVVKFGVQLGDLLSGLGHAKDAVKETTEGMKSHLEIFMHGIEQVSMAFGALAAVVGGGKLFAEAINETKAITSESVKLGRAMGITTTEASYMREALLGIGSNADSAMTAVGALTKTLMRSPEVFERLGVETKDANGQFRPMADILVDVNEKFAKMTDGTGKNIAMAEVFGRAWRECAPAMKLTKEQMEEGRKEAIALGLVVGVENVQAAREHTIAMNGMKSVLHAMEKAIGDAVMPVLTELANWFRVIGPGAVTVIKVAISALTALFWMFGLGCTVLNETVELAFDSIESVITTAMKVAERAIHLDWAGAKREWDKGAADLEEIVTKHMDNMVSAADKANKHVADSINPPTATKSKGDEDAPTGLKGKGKGDMGEWEADLKKQEIAYAKANDMREMSKAAIAKYWADIAAANTVGLSAQEKSALDSKVAESELAMLKQAKSNRDKMRSEEITATEAHAKAQVQIDVARAQSEKDTGQITEEQFVARQVALTQRQFAVEAKAQSERIALARAEAADKPAEYKAALDKMTALQDKFTAEMMKQADALAKYQSAQAKAKADEAISLAQSSGQFLVDIDRATAQNELSIGNITQAQMLAQEKGFLDRSYALELDAGQKRLAAIIAEHGIESAEAGAAYNKLVALRQKYELDVTKVAGQSVAEQSKELIALRGTMTGVFDSAFNTIYDRTKSFNVKMHELFKNLGKAFIEELVFKPLSAYLAGQAQQLASTITTGTAKVAAQSATEGTMTAASLAGSIARVANDWWASAQSVAATAASAVANIAAKAWEAAASVYAAIAGIPYIGPFLAPAMAIGAAVLVGGFAAHIASAEGGFDIPSGMNPITQLHEQEMVLPKAQANAVRDMAAGKGGGGGSTTVVINAMDAHSVKRLFMNNPGALSAAIQHAKKNGHFS